VNLRIVRTLHPDCSTGALYLDGHPELVLCTMEQPWADNVPFHSCVPPGKYRLEPHSSPKHPVAYALVNPALNIFHEPLPNPQHGARFGCLIHAANWAYQLEGCIAPGDKIIQSDKGLMVTNSVAAVKKLFQVMGVGITGHTLEITQ
jgi:hypothetical protein